MAYTTPTSAFNRTVTAAREMGLAIAAKIAAAPTKQKIIGVALTVIAMIALFFAYRFGCHKPRVIVQQRPTPTPSGTPTAPSASSSLPTPPPSVRVTPSPTVPAASAPQPTPLTPIAAPTPLPQVAAPSQPAAAEPQARFTRKFGSRTVLYNPKAITPSEVDTRAAALAFANARSRATGNHGADSNQPLASPSSPNPMSAPSPTAAQLAPSTQQNVQPSVEGPDWRPPAASLLPQPSPSATALTNAPAAAPTPPAVQPKAKHPPLTPEQIQQRLITAAQATLPSDKTLERVFKKQPADLRTELRILYHQHNSPIREQADAILDPNSDINSTWFETAARMTKRGLAHAGAQTAIALRHRDPKNFNKWLKSRSLSLSILTETPQDAISKLIEGKETYKIAELLIASLRRPPAAPGSQPPITPADHKQ